MRDETITCADGHRLVARLFTPPPDVPTVAAVLIAPATGVQARHYWRYAAYLAARGLETLVPDYRGIGRSVPPDGARGLRRLRTRWHEWGTLDLDACIVWMRGRTPPRLPLCFVGHSYGGVAVMFAPHAGELARIMLVGAQHAFWRDHDRRARLSMLWRWHVVMPTLTLLFGYFPGRRLGWLEDLPRGVAWDWAFGRADHIRRVRSTNACGLGDPVRQTSAVLLVNPTDDPYATPAAARRVLAQVPTATACQWRVAPEELGTTRVGHFGLFREEFAETFWRWSARWLEGSYEDAHPATW